MTNGQRTKTPVAARAPWLAFALVALFSVGGCTALLDLKEEVAVADGGADGSCADGSCEGCVSDDDCGANASCVAGVCTTSPTPDDGGPDDAPMSVPDAEAGTTTCAMVQCGANEECAVEAGVVQCECATGYELDGDSCVDIDECAQADRGGCSVNADCTNVDGGRTCKCESGYEDTRGDGTECVDKCTLAECHAEAECSLMGGEAVCRCPSTHTGDGMNNCEFDAECANLDCDDNATCEVNGSQRECVCVSGYEDDGAGGCQDVNECDDPDFCGDDARCENAVGEWECVGCGAGYEASDDGLSCQDIDECMDGTDACGANGTCMNTPAGSYSCDCEDGYSENVNALGQPTCTLTGACEADMDNCVDNADHGTCTSTGGMGFTCGCMAGYAGNGTLVSAGGTGCTRIPRCNTDGNCGPRQTCNDTATGFECVCDDTPSQCPDDDSPSTYCTSGGVERHCVADSDGCIYIDSSLDVVCADADQTCFNGQCRGSCASGTTACVDGQNAIQFCQSNGEPGGTAIDCDDDSGGPDFEVCRGGSCVDSPDQTYGYPESATDWNGTTDLPGDRWRIVHIQVDEPVRLYAIHASFSSPPGSARMRGAVWTDRNNALGHDQPDDLVYRSPIGYSVLDPSSRILVDPSVVVLDPGYYWVGINVNESVSVPFNNDAGAQVVNRSLDYADDPATNGLFSFPNVASSSGTAYGIWIVARPVL